MLILALYPNLLNVSLKNKNVFPMVYVTSDTISESKFDKLFYPYNLDTIYNRTIVNGETSNEYTSKMKLIKNLDQSIVVQNKKKTKKTIPIDFDAKNKLICIDFDVKNYTDKKISISINGMKIHCQKNILCIQMGINILRIFFLKKN